MTVHEQLRQGLSTHQLERQADLEQYRQKVLLRSLTQRTTMEPPGTGQLSVTTWVQAKRLTVEIGEDPNTLINRMPFKAERYVSLFSNAYGQP